jgi:cytochrome c oxidase cbb3-type subunit 3
MGITFFYAFDMMGDDVVNISTLAIGSLILILSIGSSLHYAHQIKNTKATGDLFPMIWDGIREYDNPIPTVWGISFLLSMVFAMYYILVGYPTNSFSQIGQYNEEVLEYNAKFDKKWASIKNDKEELVKMGESLYLNQCAVCHGVLADGLDGKSQDLIYWGSEKHIESVILNGSKGSGFATEMPPLMAMGEDAKAISSYVSSEFFKNENIRHKDLVEKGKSLYVTCAGCHGVEGNGIIGVAPSLRKLTTSVLNTGRSGTIGMMPKFSNLNDIQKDALNTYIYSLK